MENPADRAAGATGAPIAECQHVAMRNFFATSAVRGCQPRHPRGLGPRRRDRRGRRVLPHPRPRRHRGRYPASRLGPSPRTLRPRHPETRPASRSRLDQPTRHFHNRRNESVNRNRRCLKVVDRFRIARFRFLRRADRRLRPRSGMPHAAHRRPAGRPTHRGTDDRQAVRLSRRNSALAAGLQGTGVMWR